MKYGVFILKLLENELLRGSTSKRLNIYLLHTRNDSYSKSIALEVLLGIPKILFKWFPFLSVIALICGFIFTLGLLVINIKDEPKVYVSWSSGECVKVLEEDGSVGSCYELPETYSRVWVK